MSATCAAGGVCAFLFFVVDLGLWPAVGDRHSGIGTVERYNSDYAGRQHRVLGESKATGASLIGFSNQSGGVFGAGLSGVLLATMGYQGIGYLCVAFALAAAVVAAAFARQLA